MRSCPRTCFHISEAFCSAYRVRGIAEFRGNMVMQVLWDSGLAGNCKVDIVTVVSVDKLVAAQCFPQAGARVHAGDFDLLLLDVAPM